MRSIGFSIFEESARPLFGSFSLLYPSVIAPWGESMLSEIRRATTTDVPALFHVRTSVRESLLTETEVATLGITRRSLAEMLDSDAARAWCVEDHGSIVGFSLAVQESREIPGLFVLPDYEKHGIGSLLLDAAISWLWELSDKPIRLVVDPCTTAYSFYRSRGWTDLGFGPTEEMLEGDVYLELNQSQGEGPCNDA